MNVVVIIPTYNERENIIILLDSLRRICATIKGYEFTLLVVDDNSPDGTAAQVLAYHKIHKDVEVLTGTKQGLGRALLRGMTHAVENLAAEILVQIDGDLSHDPRKLPEFFHAIDKGYDFVIGSRYIPGGGIPPNWGIHRKAFSIVGNALVRFGLGFPRVHDWTGGFRVYHKRYYELLAPQVRRYSGYVVQIAFLHKAVLAGAKVFEVPFHFTDRMYGRSKIAPLQYIRNVILYVVRARIRQAAYGSFGKFAVVGTIGLIINTIVLEVFVDIGQHPAVGSALGAQTAIISNFFLNNSWTFKGRRVHGLGLIPKFFQFNLASLGGLIIQAGSVAIGTQLWGRDSYRLFYVFGVGVGLMWNYVLYSRVIWKR